ncbi:hypothetical protein BH09BAC3_BH09BAC3_10080 [soil metagenome]
MKNKIGTIAFVACSGFAEFELKPGKVVLEIAGVAFHETLLQKKYSPL